MNYNRNASSPAVALQTENDISLYLAPMEGITGYVYRMVYHRLYGDVDKYFTPFLSPMQKRRLKSRDKKDVDPENNKGMKLVPQILTNSADQFLETVEYLEEIGYMEINLNLGCPSPTVVTKGKGAGFLADPEELDRFFYEVFDRMERRGSKVKISIKSRLGISDPEEIIALMEVYQTYPVTELILHPRVQRDMYKNSVNQEMFAWVYENCSLPLCYNGDIFSLEDDQKLRRRFPELRRIMLGRGLIADPGLPAKIRGNKEETAGFDKYTEELYRAYCEAFGNRQDAVYHMKEIWAFKELFSDETDKTLKKIRKAKNPDQYEAAVYAYFQK